MQQSSSPSQSTGYIYHDYSIFNKHLEQQYLRDSELTRARRAETFINYASWTAILLCAIGLATLLILWGVSLILDDGEPAAHHHNPPFTRAPNLTDDADPAQTVVYKHTRFATRLFDKDGFTSVVTGHVYPNSYETEPTHQYCYMTKPNLDGTSMRVDVSAINEGSVEFLPISHEMIQQLGTSFQTLSEARNLCEYV
jgi:hypothetical protein